MHTIYFASPACRAVPRKRQVMGVSAVMGSSGWAALRWVTGQWLPSVEQLARNPYVGAYILASALIGAAIAYLYDDRSNPKINTLIRVR